MRWRRLECLGVVLAVFLATALVPNPTTALVHRSKPPFSADDCDEVLSCHRCSLQEVQEIRECESPKDKIRTLSCPLVSSSGDAEGVQNGGEEVQTVTRYMTCQRTAQDEHTRFVHFQLFCLVLGTLSFIWVRKYRVIYASLFEQRKLLFTRLSRRPSDTDLELAQGGGGGNLELATTATTSNSSSTSAIHNAEEMIPLHNSNLEVI